MKVSVIIPIYQVEAYVEECLTSVLEQTLTDLEIICIHDAGQDGSWKVVQSAAAKDRRIRLVENERNRGLAAVRNRGLRLARGKYVYFLDADDKIMPDALEELYQRAEKEALDVQIFGASFIYANQELEKTFSSNPSGFKRDYPEVMEGKELFTAWMETWDWISSQPRYFYRRGFLEEHQLHYIEGMLHEDEPFAFDVLMYARRVRVYNEQWFIRRFRADSIMTGVPTVKNVEGCMKILAHVASMQEIYQHQPSLNRAVKFYLYKIFCDAVRKYRRAAEGLEEEGENKRAAGALEEEGKDKRAAEALKEEGKIEKAEVKRTMMQMVSEDAVGNPAEMAFYHLIEAFGLWEKG